MTTQMQKSKSQTIPLSNLILSTLNVRTVHTSDESIGALAASLQTHGQIENLVVIPEKKKMAVVAGGRRLAALQLLLKQKKIKADHPVRCEVVAAEHALELSAAENSNREAMNPIDEFESFRKMVDNGRPIEDVAAAFGVTPLVVQRRLKLAALSPKMLERYRKGDIDNLEVLMAFTLTDDHDKQEQVWKQLERFRRTPQNIRQLLSSDCLRYPADALAKFVGIKAYTKAGGEIRHDLFSEDEGEAQFLNVPLVHELAQAKLDAKAEKLKGEGFAWVEGRIEFEYGEKGKFSHVPMVRSAPTKAQAKRLNEIETRIGELEALIDKADEGEGDDSTKIDALYEEDDALREEQQEIEDGLRIPDPACAAVAGAIVSIGHSGQFEITKGLVRPEDKKLAKDAEKQVRAAQGATGSDDEDEAAQATGYSERTNRALTAHLTLALRCEVAKSSTTALALVVTSLVEAVFERFDVADVAVTVTGECPSMDEFAPDIALCKATATLKEIRETWDAKLPKESVFEWALTLAPEQLLELFTFCVASTVNAVAHRGMPHEGIRSLMRAVNLQMPDYWRPTSLNYLGSVSKMQILEAVTQGVDEETAKSMSKCKKAELITKAEASLASTQWVPNMFKVS